MQKFDNNTDKAYHVMREALGNAGFFVNDEQDEALMNLAQGFEDQEVDLDA